LVENLDLRMQTETAECQRVQSAEQMHRENKSVYKYPQSNTFKDRREQMNMYKGPTCTTSLRLIYMSLECYLIVYVYEHL
jgi:hypothetical protein